MFYFLEMFFEILENRQVDIEWYKQSGQASFNAFRLDIDRFYCIKIFQKNFLKNFQKKIFKKKN